MRAADTLSFLLSGQAVSLASWFADPLTRQQAAVWLARIRRRTGSALSDDQARLGLKAAELIVRYWHGDNIDAVLGTTLALFRQRRERALLKFCYGQLLIARKVDKAWRYLDSGFDLAAHILEAEDYFIVLKRHALLRVLALSPGPSKPMRLDDLLTEAEVIQRITAAGGGTRRSTRGPLHYDTTD